MIRTNVVLNEKLVHTLQKLTHIKTKKDLIDYALCELLRREKQKKILSLRGKIHWEGNLEVSRKKRNLC